MESVRGADRGKLSSLEVRDLNRHARTLAGIASFRLTWYTASGDAVPEAFPAAMSTYNLFEVLGVAPQLGSGCELVGSLDPNQSFFDVRPMAARLADRTWVPRLSGALFSVFGALAATLAAIGVFAVLAYAVAQRTRELGVRQALGAPSGALARQVIGDGMRLVLIGGVIGLISAVAGAQLFRGLLFNVSPLDPAILVSVPLLLAIVAGLACWIPARRAMRVAPIEALRSE